jgi:membrane associated rhomboid family serine protease
MYRTNFYRIGPSNTPLAIKWLLFLTAFLSFLSALQISFFPNFPLFDWLSFSWGGFKNHLYYQVFSYVFLTTSNGLSFGFFAHLLFNLYLLWMFGSSLVQSYSSLKFLILFFGSSIVSALSSLGIMSLFYPTYQLVGSSIMLYSYLIAWVITNPYSEIRLFFAIPFRAKGLIVILLGLNLLFDLADGDLVAFCSRTSAAIFAYLYSVIVYKIHSPFSLLVRFEKKLRHPFRKSDTIEEAKIIDIRTKKAIDNDDQFMDQMLAKIAKEGEKSLSWREKRRMKKISKRKNSK